jgi:signal transduction histidine kinase
MPAAVIDLNAVVQGARELLSSSIGPEVELIVHAAPDLPSIWGDRGLIEQILVNLAVNAHDAMPEGGTLTLRTASMELDAETAAVHPAAHPGPYVELAISDDGSGMSPEVLARASEPFFSTKARSGGAGLGLAIVHGIVSEAGGFLVLASDEAQGTVVRVCLPAGSEKPS